MAFTAQSILEETLTWANRQWVVYSAQGPATMAMEAFASLLAALFACGIWRRYYSRYSGVPGPFLASFSHLWHVRQIWAGQQNLRMIEQHDKHGHFVRIAHDEISVSHPDAVKALFLAPLQKSPWYSIFAFPDYRYPMPISVLNPSDKAQLSKYLKPAYSLSNVIKSEDVINSRIGQLLDWMDKYAAEKKAVDLERFFYFTAFDIVGEMSFSKSFGFLDAGEDLFDSIRLNYILEGYFSLVGFTRWIHYALTHPIVAWSRLVPPGHIVDTARESLQERAKNVDARFDMVTHWFRALDKVSSEKGSAAYRVFNSKMIESAAGANVAAGGDTVTVALQSFVYHMIRTPGAWQRARAEIDEAQKQGRCGDRVVANTDAVQLPYLQACVKEAMRIFSPVAMGMPRVTPKGGLTLGGRYFPEGVVLSVNPWVLNYSKEIWGPDARTFNPNRWLESGISEKERFFVPFGAGWGSCSGQHLARIELNKILATIVRDYDIHQVDPGKEWEWHA